MRRTKSRTSGAAILFIVWSLTMAIGAAAAHAAAAQQIVEIDFLVPDRNFEGDPGDLFPLLVPPHEIKNENIGTECEIVSVTDNNKSVHVGNDLVVKSGGSTVTLSNVERGPLLATRGDGRLTLSDTVTIDMRLGEDGRSSGGYEVVAICDTEICRAALTIGVVPEDQEVVIGGDASFDVTLTNNGNDDFITVDVDSSIDACDTGIGALAAGASHSYSCTAVGVDTDTDASLHAVGQAEDQACVASADATVHIESTQQCTTKPDLTVTVAPLDQEVPVDGDASFQVTVTNSGDEDLQDVVVASSVAACDQNIGDLAVGAESSYSCTATGVGGDLIVSFDADGRGVSDPAVCEALGSVAATVGNPTTTTKATTTTSSIPIKIPTGTGDAPGPAVPVGVLAVFGLGIVALGAGTYWVARKER